MGASVARVRIAAAVAVACVALLSSSCSFLNRILQFTKIRLITEAATRVSAKALTAEDVEGGTATPDFVMFVPSQVGLVDYSKASSAANIVDKGNDAGVLDYLAFSQHLPGGASYQYISVQIRFENDLENELMQYCRNPEVLRATVYSAIIVIPQQTSRGAAMYWYYDPDGSGMTDYPTQGTYITPHGAGMIPSSFITTEVYWDHGGSEVKLSDMKRIVLVDRSLLHRYWFFLPDPSGGIAGSFYPDGSLKETVHGYEQLTAGEREFVSYILITYINGQYNDRECFKSYYSYTRPPGEPFDAGWALMDCAKTLFIPIDALDLTDMFAHAEATIDITWDLSNVLYERYVPTEFVPGDYAFLLDPDPWNSAYGEASELAGGSGQTNRDFHWRKYFRRDGEGSYVRVPPEEAESLAEQGEQLYEKKPYIWETDPTAGPFQWNVSVKYGDR